MQKKSRYPHYIPEGMFGLCGIEGRLTVEAVSAHLSILRQCVRPIGAPPRTRWLTRGFWVVPTGEPSLCHPLYSTLVRFQHRVAIDEAYRRAKAWTDEMDRSRATGRPPSSRSRVDR